MKKVLIVLVALLPLMAQAQKLDVAQTTIVKKGMPMNQRNLDGVRFLEPYADKYYCVLEVCDAFNIFNTNVKVVSFDAKLKKIASNKLEALHNKDVLQVSLVDNKMYLLVSDRKGRKEKGNVTLGLSCCIIDLTTLEMNEMKLLGQSDSQGQVLAARSADKDFFVVVSQQWDSKIDNAHVWLYDNHLEPLWDRVVDCGFVTDLAVNNEGEVAVASEDSKRAIMTFVDVEDYVMGSVEMDDNTPYAAQLLSFDKNNIVIGGLLADLSSKGQQLVTTGYYGAALNLRTGKSQAEHRLFSDKELVVIGNTRIDKEFKNSRGYQNVHPRAKTATSYGGAMMLSMAYKEVIEMRSTNGASTTQIYYRVFGAVTFGVDTTGRIVWSRPLRRSAYTKDFDFVNEVMVSKGDVCYLMMNENKSESSTPNDVNLRSGKTYIFHSSTPLSVYRIDARGDVVKKTTKKFPAGMGVVNVVERPSADRVTLRVSSKKNSVLMDVELK